MGRTEDRVEPSRDYFSPGSSVVSPFHRWKTEFTEVVQEPVATQQAWSEPWPAPSSPEPTVPPPPRSPPLLSLQPGSRASRASRCQDLCSEARDGGASPCRHWAAVMPENIQSCPFTPASGHRSPFAELSASASCALREEGEIPYFEFQGKALVR